MSFSMKSLTLLLTAIFLNTAYSSSNNTQNNSNNIQNNTIQNNNYSNIGTVCNSCIINNNDQNNLNDSSNNIIQNCNTQYNTYSNINRVCNNCIVNSNIINSNMQINPFFHPYYYLNSINGFVNNNAFYYPFNNLINNSMQINPFFDPVYYFNPINNFLNTNNNNSSNNIQYNLDASKFYPRDYCLKQALSFIKENKTHKAKEFLNKFISKINKNVFNIPNNILSNWLETASESIDSTYNDSLKQQKSNIIQKIVETCSMSDKEVLAKVVALVALNDDANFLVEVKKLVEEVYNNFNENNKKINKEIKESDKEINKGIEEIDKKINEEKNKLEQEISDLRKKTKEYYRPVENLKKLLINALKDDNFSVQYKFYNNKNEIYKIITHLFDGGHIINNNDINREKHTMKETLIHGIENMEYYQDIKQLIQLTYNNKYNAISLFYKKQIYNIIQYCLIDPLINKFVNNTIENNTYISDFVIDRVAKNNDNNMTAILCVINKNNHNKLVLNLNIKKNNYKRRNINIKVTNTIKSFYGISTKEHKKFEKKHNNYTSTYIPENKKYDSMYEKQYEKFKK